VNRMTAMIVETNTPATLRPNPTKTDVEEWEAMPIRLNDEKGEAQCVPFFIGRSFSRNEREP